MKYNQIDTVMPSVPDARSKNRHISQYLGAMNKFFQHFKIIFQGERLRVPNARSKNQQSQYLGAMIKFKKKN